MSDSKKLKQLKEIRRKDLEKNLLDIELKGYDHYIFINERNKAQVVSKKGGWITEHIRTAVLKFNFEIDKTEKMLVKDFEKKYLKEYEKTFLSD
tara:strand:- start:895 stop:1176 length:282 start_codon:yes stop_codon:yes gene_type:complete